MDKFKTVLIIIGCVIFSYICLLTTFDVIVGIANSVADEMAVRPGIGEYVLVCEAMRYTPFFLFLVPSIGGMVAVVLVLKFDWGNR